MKIGLITREEYGHSGLQTFEKNIMPPLLEQLDETEEVVWRPIGNNIPLSHTLGDFIQGWSLTKKINKLNLDKMFLPSQNQLIFDPKSVNCEVIVYVHDIIPATHNFIAGDIGEYITQVTRSRIVKNLSNVDKIITASEVTKNEVVERTLYSGNVEVVYQGIDNIPVKKEDKKYDLLYVGSSLRRKDPKFIREIFQEAVNKGHNVVSVSDIDLPGKNKQNLSTSELASIYSKSRFFLHSSLAEGFGRCPVEAQRNRCMPIARDLPINREILGKRGKHWKIFESKDDVFRYLNEYPSVSEIKGLRDNSRRFRWSRTIKNIKGVLCE